MLVSAIVTTHNREPEIVGRAIKSIVNQSYKNIEIIVVDDSSADYPQRPEIRKLIEVYLNDGVRIKYISHEVNRGACAARNTGLAESRGEIIGFLDDDDEWMPQKVEVMIEAFMDEDVGLVYGNNILKNDDTGYERVVKRHNYCGSVYDKLILCNFIGSTSFPLFRRKSLVSVGGFDENMQSAQDADAYLRVSKEYHVVFVNDVVAIYHLHNKERISSSVDRKISGLERINEKNAEYLDNNRKAFWIRKMKLATYYAKRGDWDKSYNLWVQCVKKRPLSIVGNTTQLLFIIHDFYMIGKKRDRVHFDNN